MIASLILMTALAGQVSNPLPSEAVGWAIGHQSNLPEEERPLYRYLWVPTYIVPQSSEYQWSDIEVAAALSYAINEAASQSGVIVPTQAIANGWMVTVYLPNYASPTKPSPADKNRSELQMLVDVWDGLALNDPYLHVTKENNFTEVIQVGKEKKNQVRTVKAAVLAGHIEPKYAEILHEWNRSPALVYRADWFLEQLLHRSYYEFMQYGKTQQDIYLTIGVSEQLVRDIEGDQRVAMTASEFTGKPRRIDRLQGAAGRNATGAAWQTWDIFDDSVAANKNVMYNLIEFQPDGGEGIFEMRNGLHGYYIIDATRNLIRTANADKLIADRNIPNAPDGPGSKPVIPGIGCIRCHGVRDGLLPAPNHVKMMLERGRTDILGDIGNGKTAHENALTLAGLYAGNFDDRLERGREDYEKNIRLATFMPDRPGGMDVVETASIVSALYGNYAYLRVTTAQACAELGEAVQDGEDAIVKFNKILTPLPPENGNTFSRENATIAPLRIGIPVRRREWEQVYAAALYHKLQTKGTDK